MSESVRPVTPRDVLPDGVDEVDVAGITVRKGSVAAFVANAESIGRLRAGTAEYDAVAARLRELTPALRAVGVFDVFEPRSEQVRAIIGGA